MPLNKRKFYAAAEKGDLKKLQLYMDYDHIDEPDRFGRTALFLAISKNYLTISENHLAVIDFLLEHKANIYKSEKRAGNTPLDISLLSTNNEVLKRFLEKRVIDDKIKYLLMEKLAGIDSHCARQLHNALLTVNCIQGTLSETQPVYGSERLRIEKIRLLIAALHTVNKENIQKLLSLSIRSNNIETAKLFIDLILEKQIDIEKSFMKNRYLSSYWDEQLKKLDLSQSVESVPELKLKHSVSYTKDLNKMFASFSHQVTATTQNDPMSSESRETSTYKMS